MEPLIQKLGITKEEAGKLEVINKIEIGFLINKCYSDSRYSSYRYREYLDAGRYHDQDYPDCGVE